MLADRERQRKRLGKGALPLHPDMMRNLQQSCGTDLAGAAVAAAAADSVGADSVGADSVGAARLQIRQHGAQHPAGLHVSTALLKELATAASSKTGTSSEKSKMRTSRAPNHDATAAHGSIAKDLTSSIRICPTSHIHLACQRLNFLP